MRRAFLFVALTFASLVAACGGAAPPAPAASPAPANVTSAPSATEEREPTSVDEARQQIARARAVLEPPAPGLQTGQQPPAAPLDSSSSSACTDACRALASMRRAVDALCRLAGDSDDECTDARATLSRCEARTASCGC